MITLKLPNLLETPNTRLTYIIDGFQYIFHFKWCNTFCLLDIYVLEDNSEIYLVKGRPLTINSNIIARVNDPDLITGTLYLMHKYNENIEPDIDNFHKDYYFVYEPEV